MLNILLFSKLPLEIRFTIYIGLLTYYKKRLQIKGIINEINDLSKINLNETSESNLYYDNDSFTKRIFNRLSLENTLFLSSIHGKMRYLYSNNSRFILHYDDERIFRELGNLHVNIFTEFDKKTYILNFDSFLIFNKNELKNSMIRIETLDSVILSNFDYNNYLFQDYKISFVWNFNRITDKRYFKRIYFKRITYNIIQKSYFIRKNEHLSSEYDYPRYKFIFEKIMTTKGNLKNYYKQLAKNIPNNINFDF